MHLKVYNFDGHTHHPFTPTCIHNFLSWNCAWYIIHLLLLKPWLLTPWTYIASWSLHLYICMFIQKMIFIIFIITFLGSELDTTLFAHLNRFNFFIDEIGYLIRRHNFWTNNFYLTLYEYFRTMLLTKYNSYIFTVASANKLKHFSWCKYSIY